ncbi:Cytochrome c5 [Marinobacterium lacunae]|uniref:Cytochrome c5 n=1 Tax=Marinobacterium lacunae TaxID=1232683 RepID=A0A081FZZ7_9GAMM|nr:c-type cytochrome [Marinobacterium lacunae]KEA64102.1 Cytochrome c5 [Marinobacterium lacunae]
MRILLAFLFLTAVQLSTAVVKAEPNQRQIKLFQVNCAQCHVSGLPSIPAMGRPEDWVSRNQRGEDALLANVVQGLGGMPPSGYCSACSETDLRVLVRLVSGTEE